MAKVTTQKKPTASRRTATPKAKTEKKVTAITPVANDETEAKKKPMYYRNIKDKSIIAKVVKRPNKSTVILGTIDDSKKTVTVSVGTLEKLWEAFEPEAEQIASVDKKAEKIVKEKKRTTATAEWANVDALTSAVKKLVVDMTYKLKHNDRDLLCYSGKHNVISFYIAKDRIRVLFKENEEIRKQLSKYEIVKGTAQPSANLYYEKHTAEDLQHVVDTIVKIATAEKPAKAKKSNKKAEVKENVKAE